VECAIGDRVELVAPDNLADDGSIIFAGAAGLVIGYLGFGGLVVSWDQAASTSLVNQSDLRRLEFRAADGLSTGHARSS